MKTLYLLRHATAEEGTVDFDRPLAPEGRDEAQKLGLFMRERGYAPARILSSDARRTRETAELAGLAAEQLPALYLADPPVLLETIRGAGDAGSLLVLAHNPGLAEVGSRLADDYIPFAPATLAVFHIDGAWEDVSPENAKLVFVYNA